ncbi:MAG: hypothetical protein K6E27_03950 [Eubacterium sp.]|nr:hypothetical protein [Eubacterium sp.]
MTNNLTEKDKFLNTYSNYSVWRVVSFLVCLFSLIYFPKKDNEFFFSYYDHIMNREIFHSEDGFWKQMTVFMIMSYSIAMAVLLVNTILVAKERREGAFADIAIYGYLTLLNPAYVLISMIGSRSSGFYEDAKYAILIIPAVYFLAMLIFHIRLYLKNKEGFYDMKDDPLKNSCFAVTAVIMVLVLVILPGKNAISAIKMSKDYSINYGLYKARPGEIEGIDEDTIGNKNNGGFIWNDNLYIVTGHVIETVDERGEVVEKYDMGMDAYRWVFYSDESNACLFIGDVVDQGTKFKTFNVYRFDLINEETELIFSEDYFSDYEGLDLFAIKDDYLYYKLHNELTPKKEPLAYNIYRFSFPKSSSDKASEKEIYVSDVGVTGALESAFLYNYDIIENKRMLTSSYKVPYKGALYYTESMSGKLGDPVDHYNVLYRKENGADKNQGDKIGLELFVENADKLTDNATYMNIYKDKIFFVDNKEYYEETDDGEKNLVSRSRLCSMNLDGSDMQVLDECEDSEHGTYFYNVWVSDDYIVYYTSNGHGEYKVIKR